MVELSLRIHNPEGLHARPAGLFVKRASEFQSKVEVVTPAGVKNAKSIMTLMSLGLRADAELKLQISGADESAAAEALKALVENRFQA